MKPTANLIIGFFYKICVNSRLNRTLGRHAHRVHTATQRENEARTARILHQSVMQMRSRLHSH